MSFKSKILITIFLIAAFDAVGSALSRLVHLDYADFIWGSNLLYLAVGYWGAYRQGFAYGVLLGGIAGLTDSTIGWVISTFIGPFTSWAQPYLTNLEVLLAIIVVSTMGLVLGTVGAGVCKIFGQSKFDSD